MKFVILTLSLLAFVGLLFATSSVDESNSVSDLLTNNQFEEGVRGKAKALEKLDQKTSKTNKEIPKKDLKRCVRICKAKFRFFDLKHCPVDKNTIARCGRLVCKFKKNRRAILKNVVKVYLASWTKRQRVCLKVRKCKCSTKKAHVCMRKGKRVIKFTNRCMAKCYLHKKHWGRITACTDKPPRKETPKPRSCAHCYLKKKKCVFSLFSMKRYYNKCEAKCRGVTHIEPCVKPTPKKETPTKKKPQPTNPKTPQERAICREKVAAVCLNGCADTCKKGYRKNLAIIDHNTMLRRNKIALKDGKCPKKISSESLAKVIRTAKKASSHKHIMKKVSDCLWDCTKLCYADPDLEVIESVKKIKELSKAAPVVKDD